MSMDQFLICAKIIEFFWFLLIALLFVFVALIKFYLKKDIHSDPPPQSEIKGIQYHMPQHVPPPQHTDPQDEIQIVLQVEPDQPKPPSSVNNTYTTTQPTSRIETIFKGVDEIVNNSLPVLSVAILCINNFASYGFAVACVFLYSACVILFNQLYLQSKCTSGLQIILQYSNSIWIFALCLNYLIVNQEYSNN